MKSNEERMDEIIFRDGKEGRYDGRIADIRRFRLNMLADKQVGIWARVLRWLK